MEGASEAQRACRVLFAADVDAHDSGRPGYPEPVYDLLREVCGLGSRTRVLEIGPGTGQATGRLLDHGASVTAIELGADLARRLRAKYADRDLAVEVGPFEEVELAAASIDLIVAATSFHLVPTDTGLRRCADILRPGGWLALWWTNFGDPARPDPFHDALVPILTRLAPSLLDVTSAGNVGSAASPYALDAERRIAELDATDRFGAVRHEVIAWTGRHGPGELRNLFASFSPWLALPTDLRDDVLDALEQLATDTFGGVVERPYLTPIYLARRHGNA
ncbi:MAG: class I SAM-dependent methyltransferase [Acidimicrobiales bacterium]